METRLAAASVRLRLRPLGAHRSQCGRAGGQRGSARGERGTALSLALEHRECRLR